MSAADLVLVPAAPDVVSIENTRRFLRGLEAEGLAGEHLMPVLNATALAPSIAPSHAAEALGRPTIWEVPFDSHVAGTNQHGIQPAAAPARSPALRSLRALAGRIAHDPASIERRPHRASEARRHRPLAKRTAAPLLRARPNPRR
jgi:Flp pilus assembly CpaE family ATPase